MSAIRAAIQSGAVAPEDAREFERLQKAAATDNIEQLLSFARGEGDAAPRDTFWHIARAIGSTLESSIGFSFLDGQLASRDFAHRQLATLLREITDREGDGVAVVTVNYDVCADVAILDTGRVPYYCLNERRNARPTKTDEGPPEIALAKLPGAIEK